jgi:hypothetical protein
MVAEGYAPGYTQLCWDARGHLSLPEPGSHR